MERFFYILLLVCVPMLGVTQTPTTYGSGFAVANNYVVTNFHTINGSDGILITGVKGDMTNGYVAKVVATDAVNDIALLKVVDTKFVGFGSLPYSLKKGNETVGAEVTAVGFEALSATNNKCKPLNGKVTAIKGISGSSDHFQTDLQSNPNNSGSPLYNADGDVTGMLVSYIYKDKDINFVVRANVINRLLLNKKLTIPNKNQLKELKADQKATKIGSIVCMVMCFKGGVGTIDSFISSKAEKKVENNINGHECVDLGLSVRWATCNIGALKPEDFGSVFSWGEVKTKNNFSPGDYAYSKSLADTWVNIGADIKNTKYDVARSLWGDGWRLPTAIEVRELLEKCKWEWITINEKNGFKVTGPNGKSIFLPAAGVKMLDESYYENSYGYYWTSTLNASDAGNAYNLYFFSTYRGVDSMRRYFGLMARGVTK